MSFEERAAGIPAEFQINGPPPASGDDSIDPLNLTSLLNDQGITDQAASITGPATMDTAGMLPVGQTLPYTINFENPSEAATATNEIQVITELDDNLDLRSFRLGDLQIGDIHIHIPSSQALFQGDFDFTEALGFVVRVSGGIDLSSRTATWLIQAIDPLTGEVNQDPNIGLLPPNNAQGRGAGYVSYTIEVDDEAATGDEVVADARVLFDNAPPRDTLQLNHRIDAVAPTTELTVNRLSSSSSNFEVTWSVADDDGGSGFRHVTIYVAENGGDFRIWQRQVQDASGSEIFAGEDGVTYEFLALATDLAGNRERAPFAFTGPVDAASLNFGALPTGDTTPANYGIPPEPSSDPAIHVLFEEAEQRIPAADPLSRAPVFSQILQPFVGHSFATGFSESYADIGPMAIAETPGGEVLISGGPSRNLLYRFDMEGGVAEDPFAELPYPIFNLAFDNLGSLWATTGGGPLLQLDPETGEIIHEYGEGLTIALAIQPDSGLIYVSSGNGVEIFDPFTETFTHYSRDLDLRVGSLAFDNAGDLWATTWPQRDQVVRFTERARAETMLEFDSDIDSIAFGQLGTSLEGLLFVSHNTAARNRAGEVGSGGSDLTLVDVTTLRRLPVATGGARGDVVITTSEGRALVSQSQQVDILNPALAPTVISTNPPQEAVAALPMTTVQISFDQDMYVGEASDPASILNPGNYELTHAGATDVPLAVDYDVASRTVQLTFDSLVPDNYHLHINGAILSNDGMALGDDYVLSFVAVSDLSSFLSVRFANPRSHRQLGTISYDVTVTNTSQYRDVILPIVLVLDPAFGNTSIPQNATSDSGRWFVDLSDGVTSQNLGPTESTTGQTVTIGEFGRRRIDFEAGVFAQSAPNQAPVFAATALQPAFADNPYQMTVSAADPDGPSVEFVLLTGPDGLTLDSTTGQLEWLPTSNSPASSEVAIKAFDQLGASTTWSFGLSVVGGNAAPYLLSRQTEIVGAEGQTLEVPLIALDPEDDPIRWRVHNPPPGAFFDENRQSLVWTPDFQSAGTYPHVGFVATDGVNDVHATTTFVIETTNQPPELPQPADRTLLEGERIRFVLHATDVDGETVTYDSPMLPPGATLHPDTGQFDWTPSFEQAGVHDVTFEATDGSDITSVTTTLTVENVNAPPVFNQFEGFQVFEDEIMAFRAFAFDPDNSNYALSDRDHDGTLLDMGHSAPTVTYQAVTIPSGAEFDVETALFSWKPSFDQAGLYHATFSATDDGDRTGVPATTTVTVPITVLNNNRRPVFDPIPQIDVALGSVQDIPINVTDGDNNPLTITLASALGFELPDFATFTDHGGGSATLRVAPGPGDRGAYSFIATARDDGDGGGPGAVKEETYTFVVTVVADNDPPQLADVGDRVAVVDEPFELLLKANDDDGETLDFQVAGLPATATLTPGASYGTAILNWTPSAAEIGVYQPTFTVTDGGNGGATPVASDSLTIELTVRDSNDAPLLPTLDDPVVAEGDTLTLAISATDPDGDAIFYEASNLPGGAQFDTSSGVVQWTPGFLDAGIHSDVLISVTDGHGISQQMIDIEVTNTNQPPILPPIPTQYGREDSQLQFAIGATDLDGDPIVYSVLSGLPDGAEFDTNDGTFTWTPDFEQAGRYTITFGAQDPSLASSTLEVEVEILNRNRAPVMELSHRSAALGQPLVFDLGASDPDANTTLVYSADGLPVGATLDADTGRFEWTAQPGQTGEHNVTFHVSDGLITQSRTILIRAAVDPAPPDVNITLTPSFPPIPGQNVLVHAIAESLSTIVDLRMTIDGQEVQPDEKGRFTFVPDQPGKVLVTATAEDLDGLIGTAEAEIKIKDPADLDPPELKLDARLHYARIQQVVDVIGTVEDVNLDNWQLSLSPYATDDFMLLAEGESTVTESALSQLDPGTIANGFYRLRLTARDIGGRESTTETVLEVNSTDKRSAYQRQEVDLAFEVGGTPFQLVRHYDALTRNVSTSFGNGWRFGYRDVAVETSVPLTGRESLGVYNPMQEGTRVYLTLPEGDRVGFTFAPEPHSLTGVDYYRPAWVADDGVDFQLQSVDLVLQKAGGRLYEYETGQPYHPANPFFAGHDYTLTAPDGTQYRLDSQSGIVEQQLPTGEVLSISDAGIFGDDGTSINFVRDAANRIVSATTSAGDRVAYTYDESGNLVSVREIGSPDVTRYAYDRDDTHLLRVVSTPDGGEAIDTGTPITTEPIEADLSSSIHFGGQTVTGTLAADQTLRYTFNIRQSELTSTESGKVLVAVSGEPTAGSTLEPMAPMIAGLSPLSAHVVGDRATSVYEIDAAGLNLLTLQGSGSTAGEFILNVAIVGDVDLDGLVDGVDSQLLATAEGTSVGDADYDASLDLDGDGTIGDGDRLLLLSNHGFVANRPPVLETQIPTQSTHEDLAVTVDLIELASDPEGDSVSYQIISATNGQGLIDPTGTTATFTPTTGFSGPASFRIVAEDGFSTSEAGTVDIIVSDAPLLRLEIVNRGIELDVGEQHRVTILAYFADQDAVAVPPTYVTLTSSNPGAALVSSSGVVSGISRGSSSILLSRNKIQAATGVVVGTPLDPLDGVAFHQGLDVYPFLLTLPVGGNRQLQVQLLDEVDITGADTGTVYVSGNQDVLAVSDDGLIEATGLGETTVTVLHAGGEFQSLVRVADPQVGTVSVGTDGAVVANQEGYLVAIPPGVVSEQGELDVTIASTSELALPAQPPEDFDYVGGFELDFGDGVSELGYPVQLAAPANNLTAGENVYFFRYELMPNEQGSLTPVWLLEEQGVVGTDGVIRTSSPPWPGLSQKGQYLIANANKNLTQYQIIVDSDQAQFTSGGTLESVLMRTDPTPSSDRVVPMGVLKGSSPKCTGTLTEELADRLRARGIPLPGTLDTFVALACDFRTFETFSRNGVEYDDKHITAWYKEFVEPVFEEIRVDRTTNPTTATIELAPPPPEASRIPVPLIDEISVGSSDDDAWVTIKGENFTVPFSTSQSIRVVFDTPNETIRIPTDVAVGSSDFQVDVPENVILGLSDIYVERPTTTPSAPTTTPRQFVSNAVQIKRTDGLTFAALAGGRVAAIDMPRLVQLEQEPAFVDHGTVRRIIDIGGGSVNETVVTNDLTRVYALVGNRIAVLDPLTLRKVDLGQRNRVDGMIKLPGSAFSIVCDSANRYLYVAAARGSIFVVDIDPRSDSFHEVVKTITLDSAPGPILQGMAVNADDRRLYVAAPATTLYGGTTPWIQGGREPGKLIVVSLDKEEEGFYHKEIAALPVGKDPFSVVATSNPERMMLTTFLDQGPGLWTLEVANDSPAEFKAKVGQVDLRLGASSCGEPSPRGFSLGICNARDVAILELPKFNTTYAFVSDWDVPFFPDWIKEPSSSRGAKIGIVEDPFGDHPRMVAATTPIPLGFADSLAFAPSGDVLYATYRGANDILTFSIDHIISTLASADHSLSEVPIDQLNSAISEELPAMHTGGLPTGLSVQPLVADRTVPLDIRETTQPYNRVGLNDPRIDQSARNKILIWAPTDEVSFDLVLPPEYNASVDVEIEPVNELLSSTPILFEQIQHTKTYSFPIDRQRQSEDVIVEYGRDFNESGTLEGAEVVGTYRVYGITEADVTKYEYHDDSEAEELIRNSTLFRSKITEFIHSLDSATIREAFKKAGRTGTPTRTVTIPLDGVEFDFGPSKNTILDFEKEVLEISLGDVRIDNSKPYQGRPSGSRTGSTVTLQVTDFGSFFEISPGAEVDLYIHDVFDFNYFNDTLSNEWWLGSLGAPRSAASIQTGFGRNGIAAGAGEIGLVEIHVTDVFDTGGSIAGGAPLRAFSSVVGAAPEPSLYREDVTPVFETAKTVWLQRGLDPIGLSALSECDITLKDLDGTALAISHSGDIILDPDGAGLGWFVDETPTDDTEFAVKLNQDTRHATATSEAHGKYDLLSVLMHEMGHLAGFMNGDAGFDSHVESIAGSDMFVGPNFNVRLSPDNNHLDEGACPHDLMNAVLPPSVRRLPSALDVQIISAARGISTASEELTLPEAQSTQVLAAADRIVAWHNSVDPHDVSGDGVVSPRDALLIVNDLNSNGARILADGAGVETENAYLDVNDDGFVSPLDALLVINHLNRVPSAAVADARYKYVHESDAGVGWSVQSAFAEGEDPGTGIINGAFEISNPELNGFGWTQAGGAQVTDGTAFLEEHDRLLAGLSQTFTLPEGANSG
ncbi:MAG: putative Ig domain-containing protein [Planctomycetota bacterium]